MNILAKVATFATVLGISSQPCLAAAVNSNARSIGAANTPSAVQRLDFDLVRHSGAVAGHQLSSAAGVSRATESLSLAASQQIASEAGEQPKRRGPGTTTWLIVGGVVLLVAVLASVAAATPTPGPQEGDFD
jgi:hypothetical protein